MLVHISRTPVTRLYDVKQSIHAGKPYGLWSSENGSWGELLTTSGWFVYEVKVKDMTKVG